MSFPQRGVRITDLNKDKIYFTRCQKIAFFFTCFLLFIYMHKTDMVRKDNKHAKKIECLHMPYGASSRDANHSIFTKTMLNIIIITLKCNLKFVTYICT